MTTASRSPLDKVSTAASRPSAIRRVVVAQWGRLYAEALRDSCQRTFPDATVSIAVNGAEVLATLYAERTDLLLLSLTLPDIYGVDLLRRIADERLAARILVAAQHRYERTLLALRDAKFHGLVDTESETLETLERALLLVAKGEPYISPTFRETVIDRDSVGIAWERLTPAEIRVFTMIADGTGNAEAAAALGLTEDTVQTHRRNLMHKLGISSSAKLVREGIRLGLVRINADGTVLRAGGNELLFHRVGIDRRSDGAA